jgi:hypothetical protein
MILLSLLYGGNIQNIKLIPKYMLKNIKILLIWRSKSYVASEE